jgi:hypothetical protein
MNSRIQVNDQVLFPLTGISRIETVFSKAVQVIAWRDLQDDTVWRQG